MPSLAKILLPVDFSERSPGAARYARALALHFGSEVILVHVLEPLFSDLGGMEITGTMLMDVYRSREEQARRQMDTLVGTDLPGVPVRRLLLNGDPASSIVKLAHEEYADLITLPTHGRGPFRRFILGSTTAKVLHDSDCPVWTGVHMEIAPAALPEFRRVLCAVDLGHHSRQTLSWAGWLSGQFGASVTVVHALAAHAAAGAGQESRR